MFAESMTIGDAIAWGTSLLDESDSIPAARSRSDAILLLRHVLGIPHAEMYAYRERPLTALQTEAFNAEIQQRLRGVPVQYIIGEQEFFGLTFHVTPDVLIPRPETEHLVEAAIARLKDRAGVRIADVGTGSGAIAVTLAHSLPAAEVVALDIGPAALAVARQNAQVNQVANRIRFVESDLLRAVADERFDAIMSNPPYVADSERKSLPAEVREYEPAQALFAGPTGLEVYRRLVPDALPLLVPGGWLMMEIGQGQREAVRALVNNADWGGVEFIADLQGIPRVAVARKR
ncbi:MAG TPA: peptide chain release factor N(5)-glutamine methyltransferase [Acidobacteriaceae bacterium]|nr:peptide chain release factor N(5)-glutamine methyltransferase [Acidobacteriaceae bacterium]